MDLSNHCKKIKTLAQLRYPKYITYLNKIPHVYQVCLISWTTGIWRSPQVTLNLVTSQLHETWASQVHAIHSQVNSKCTKYKLLSTITISFASQNISTFVFHIHGWSLKNLTSKKEGSPPLRLGVTSKNIETKSFSWYSVTSNHKAVDPNVEKLSHYQFGIVTIDYSQR